MVWPGAWCRGVVWVHGVGEWSSWAHAVGEWSSRAHGVGEWSGHMMRGEMDNKFLPPFLPRCCRSHVVQG